MIEAEHTLGVDLGIDHVWNYVQDIRKWALLFPGCTDCEVIDESDSKWTLKVGAGGLVKTVDVLVRVDRWDGPERVDFSYRLQSEPVSGAGSYTAVSKGGTETDIALRLRVEGTGPMAPMWEAVCRPVLPQLAKSFAGRLKTEIESSAGVGAQREKVAVASPSVLSVIANWLRTVWRAIREAARR